MSNMKLILDCLEKFNGNQSWELWKKQFVLLTSMQQIKDVFVLMPFVLSGSALNIYMEMSEKQQANIDEVFRVLNTAFGVKPREAYRKLQCIKYSDFSTIDEYAAEVSKLAKTVDNLEIAAFLAGLPAEIALEIEKRGVREWNEIVEVSRTYISIAENTTHASMVSLYDRREINRLEGRSHSGVSADQSVKKPHEADEKGVQKTEEDRPKSSSKSKIICFRCRRKGHIARFCRAGNVSEESSASAASRRD